MTQNSKKESDSSVEKREKTFDEFYKKNIVDKQAEIERVNIVFEKLKNKYEDYDATEAFIEYLRSVDKVFSQASKEKWSIEETEDAMIEGEIYIISQNTGIDEEVFNVIYEEFKTASHDVRMIQEISNRLIEKYSNIEDCLECDDCKDFIMYVRESLFVFSKTFDGNKNFDEIIEVKEELIRVKMNLLAMSGKPPIEILQEIYNEFVVELQK